MRWTTTSPAVTCPWLRSWSTTGFVARVTRLGRPGWGHPGTTTAAAVPLQC